MVIISLQTDCNNMEKSDLKSCRDYLQGYTHAHRDNAQDFQKCLQNVVL